jgi:NADPH2:quinone reductase
VHDGRTAYALAESTGIQEGEWVLVLAAGGGLGLLLVQLARMTGARVIGAAGDLRKLEAVRTRDADVVVNYAEPGWIESVMDATGGNGPNVVFDGAGGQIGAEALRLIAADGRFSAHGAPGGCFTTVDFELVDRRQITVKGIEQAQLSPYDGHRVTALALTEAKVGRIQPHIGLELPLVQAGEAHAAIEARSVVGKTLLIADGP